MRATFIHAPGDVRVENVPDPVPLHPTDAVIRVLVTCVCGSDLWEYRGIRPIGAPHPIGHEYVGVVEETGRAVRTLTPGQFVIGSFFASDNTCETCRNGYQTSCPQREFIDGSQAEYVRIPWADGTLVALDGPPAEHSLPSLLALSDVAGTGWYAAVAGGVLPGATVAVVGDGAVGLSAVLAARELGAERIIVMSRHVPRRQLALEFGATDIVTERGPEAASHVRELTGGIGADSVLECVGTPESVRQALHCARPGGAVGMVGVPHGVRIDGRELYDSHVAVRGGPAPVRRFLPDLIASVVNGRIDPGRVFDLTLPLDRVAEGYRAMDERRAIKALLRP
ncbi:zinc-dependent alcohol dehydrogenase family protein [Streptomyces sp. TG1A-8]|uniref:zinc-dependent alcohol dehydrogenase family protein n=1 Tax=Streptomyces sp. TG1A-8 TaxID=3051385 RepID=UPI00265C3149|nr:zinc-dependent alcohol dehydrogenase family protein [Streptomyces sp. TG1A-8]MDO0928749.1 zinc-dependent alcohol dehydrogenase family protein [Streptomyces sp. TG1A-8]